ncbi:hypothetical protein SCH4B_4202 [Ruegeria sp. TrichCH4B]|nr:hypothetical protein SCH4B_4202 [Ruegeria sp. TrichCH4B]
MNAPVSGRRNRAPTENGVEVAGRDGPEVCDVVSMVISVSLGKVRCQASF